MSCDLVISDSRIKEINLNDIKNTYPELNNSERSILTEIKRFHKPEIIQNGCKYYIQSSVDGELVNIFLDINKIQYFRLKWQLKEWLIQSKDISVDVLKYLVIGGIGSLITIGVQKYSTIQQPTKNESTERNASNKINDSLVDKDTLRLK
ncbi:hypothetical protein LX77_03866 [Gelidibacter algens]|uniref:Uncharacterized protein n=2 Tax=Gelidibacter algens TaxID=49280 RepID=A0A327RKK0_9FLAO|nr:hypothetical protein LX77_03866 [Gelidibacter algens]